jgi:hypothetical protein
LIKTCSPATEVTGWRAVPITSWPVVDIIFSDFDLQGNLMPLWNYFTNDLVI